jgi:hypothetical protein
MSVPAKPIKNRLSVAGSGTAVSPSTSIAPLVSVGDCRIQLPPLDRKASGPRLPVPAPFHNRHVVGSPGPAISQYGWPDNSHRMIGGEQVSRLKASVTLGRKARGGQDAVLGRGQRFRGGRWAYKEKSLEEGRHVSAADVAGGRNDQKRQIEQ